jgi:hypothetical protein
MADERLDNSRNEHRSRGASRCGRISWDHSVTLGRRHLRKTLNCGKMMRMLTEAKGSIKVYCEVAAIESCNRWLGFAVGRQAIGTSVLERKWNEIQNTSKDIKLLANFFLCSCVSPKPRIPAK